MSRFQRSLLLKVLLVDLHNMIHRARHSFIKGENACIFNFFRQLKSEFDRHDPDLVYLISEGRPKHRHAISSSYKANRPKEVDETFRLQKKRIYELIRHLPVKFAFHEDFECDDVIAHLARRVYRDHTVIILSTDTDFIQLLDNPNVNLWNPIKKKFVEPWPVDYLTYKSLKGDSADNIKGVSGVGDKTAMKLAKDSEAMNDFFKKKPGAEIEYTRSRELIKFANLADSQKTMVLESFEQDMDTLYTEFKGMNFKSIVGKSWYKWVDTMEKINESRSKRDISVTVG